ncbi:MAG: hypothetical protein DRJ96_04000 [Thermoprotei archaeon]|nr:DUF211 domain-containing protein [Thermoproteales archaeon]RLE97406.1 MAG: hypothetical protein DRJ96_04000 [Thermoprotei archaeon]
MKVAVVRVVFDVLKPRELDSTDLARSLCELNGVSLVNIVVREVDVRTETIRLIVEGADVDIDDVLDKLDEMGCAVRSIDSVTAKRQGEQQ